MSIKQFLIVGGLAAALAFSPVYAGNGGGANNAGSCNNCVLMDLDTLESETLTFMREEEKLARDVYDYFYGLWQEPLFDNIAAAEQRHLNRVKVALDRYELADPVAVDVAGQFTNTDLQDLYDDLTLQGEASAQEALLVGAFIEEVDIDGLELAIDGTDNPDLQRLYANLQRGSRNHLRAFVRKLESLGVVYSAQYLDQDTVDAIVDSPMERRKAVKSAEQTKKGKQGNKKQKTKKQKANKAGKNKKAKNQKGKRNNASN